jgi:hypothetical protein
VSEQLREQGSSTPAQIADQASQRVERLGNYLSESDPDKLLSDVEDFARRQPWIVLGAGVALGVTAARFLKASSRDRYQASSTQHESNGSAGRDGALAATNRPPASATTATERAAFTEPSTPLGTPGAAAPEEVGAGAGATPTV